MRLKQSRVLDSIYDAALETQQWPAALRAVAAYTNSRECLFQGYRTSDQGTECLISVSGDPDPQLFDVHRRVVAEFGDIRGEYALKKSADGNVYQDHDILSDAEIRTHPYYQEFLVPRGYRYMALFVAYGETDRSRSEAHGFSLQRTARQGPVEGDLLRRFKALIPHLSRAARLHNRIAEEAVCFLSLNDFVLPSNHACFVLDDRARVVQMNARADVLLSSGNEMFVKSETLHLKDPGLDTKFVAALGSPHTSSWNVVLNTSAGQIDLEVHRLRSSALVPTGARLCLVFAIERRSAGSEDAIRNRYNLTGAEYRLLMALATDQSLMSYAEQYGLSIHTVRTQLKSCLAKTETRSQLELVRMALRFPGP